VVRGRVVGVVVASAVLSSVAASAFAGDALSRVAPAVDPPAIQIQAVYAPDGNPDLVASFYPNGDHEVTPIWSACRPADTNRCVPLKRAGELTPGPTPPGTVFQASASFRGRTYVARSAVWLGAVHTTAAPVLSGESHYHAKVVPHRGTWVGGWKADPSFRSGQFPSGGRGRDSDWRFVEACRTRDGRGCLRLNFTPVVIGSWLTGQYLFAFDERYAADTAIATVGYGPIAPPVPVGATVARSQPLGPVTGPPAPSARILRRAVRRGTRILLARVHCQPCRVRVSAWNSDNSPVSAAWTTVKGAALVGVPAKSLRPGLLHISMHLGDYPTDILGTTRLG
jgi:hypothetical protein